MRTPLARMLAFAATVAGVFVLALIAGGASGIERSAASERQAASEGHGGGAEAEMSNGPRAAGEAEMAEGHEAAAVGHGAAPDPVRGLAVSEGGLKLDLDTVTATPGRRFDLRFVIRRAGGEVVRDFAVEHAKRMHVIVARRDLTGFQHLHPTQAADGSWSVPAEIAEPGNYRVFADFSTGGEARTLGGDLTADGPVRSRPLPPPSASATVDGMDVQLRDRGAEAGHGTELDVEVTRDGRPVATQPYLGARGHLVALREGDLAFLHVHPDADRLSFAAELPSAARYRLYLQFETADRVHTAEFTREAGR